MTFKSNEGSKDMQILCEVNLCEKFESTRGKDACRVKMDIPVKCAGKAGKSCSLLFYFHGSGGNNNRASFEKQVRQKHSGPGFIGIYPQGVNNGWSTGSNGKRDEGRFVTEIVATLKKYYGWKGLKFAAGGSNGGAFVNRIAVNSGYEFDGIAALAGQLIASPPTGGPGKLNRNTITKQTKPIPYLELHGSEDPVIPASGGTPKVFGPESNDILSTVDETLEAFAALNNCAGKNVKTISAGTTKNAEDLKAIVTTYDCNASFPVQGVMVIKGNHGVAGNIGGIAKNQYIFNWFLALRENLLKKA